MPLPRALARFNRAVTNPMMRIWAGRLPPWIIVLHEGRRSGRSYRTPVWAFRDGDELVIALTYGPEVDWVRNVVASGGCRVRRSGDTLRVIEPRVVSGETPAAVPRVLHPVLRALGVDSFLRLSVND